MKENECRIMEDTDYANDIRVAISQLNDAIYQASKRKMTCKIEIEQATVGHQKISVGDIVRKF